MDAKRFWDIIDTAKSAARGDADTFLEKLSAALTKLPPAEIVGFDAQLRARMSEAYAWPLWGAAYVMNGGCSDDGFEYWRCWLIAQGREVFENALKNPDSLASAKLKFGEEGEFEMEDLLYLAAEVHEEVAEAELPAPAKRPAAKPAGKRWDEEELDELFPKLAKKYGHGDEDDDD